MAARFLGRALERFGNARQRQYSALAQRLDAHFREHPVEQPPQKIPDGGLAMHYEGEAEPRTYGKAQEPNI